MTHDPYASVFEPHHHDSLARLGFGEHERLHWTALAADSPDVVPARVVGCHREDHLVLATADGHTRRGWPTGRLRYDALSPEDLPTVGDWVAACLHDADTATVTAIVTRRGLLARRRPGGGGQRQAIAANIDLVLLVTSVNRDLNPRRLERYLAVARDGNAAPLIVLTKADLLPDDATRSALLTQLRDHLPGVPVALVSALAGTGLDAVRAHLGAGRTAVLLGSSGVGKSTLTNALLGHEHMATRAIRETDDRGRHCTTHRELVALPDGLGLLVDTPGMRELALDAGLDEDAVDAAFGDIEALASECRFRDCEHRDEPGCAIQAAIEAGELTEARVRAWRKLLREVAREQRHERTRGERIRDHKARMRKAREHRRAARHNPKIG